VKGVYGITLAVLVGCGDGQETQSESLVEAEFVVSFANIAESDALVTVDGEVAVAFSPGVWVVRETGAPAIFVVETTASLGEEALAESGQVRDLLRELTPFSGTRGVFGGDSESSYGDQPIMPGSVVSFGFRATEGEALSLAAMFGESNDTVAATPLPLLLFDESGVPFSGAVSVSYIDAGTELNEELGTGSNQGPRQPDATSGVAEDGVMTMFDVDDPQGFEFPPLAAVLRIEIQGTVLAAE
jgi:hypothetical protein